MLAPCALGGVLDHEPCPRCAAARSPARPTTSSPRRVAELLAARGILWAPDFVANAGGIINIAVELEPEGYDRDRAEARVRAIGDTLRTIFDNAEAAGATPLAAAMALASRRLARPAPFGAQLLEVRGQRQRGGGPDGRRGVVPHAVEQLVLVAHAVGQRGEQAPLAVQAVLEVAVELGQRLPHRWAVAGADDLRAVGRSRRRPAR